MIPAQSSHFEKLAQTELLRVNAYKKRSFNIYI